MFNDFKTIPFYSQNYRAQKTRAVVEYGEYGYFVSTITRNNQREIHGRQGRTLDQCMEHAKILNGG